MASPLEYLKAYWDSNTIRKGTVKLQIFERILIKSVTNLIEKENPDFRILKKLDEDTAYSLSTEITKLSSRKLDYNSMMIIDKVLSFCHTVRYKTDALNHIFVSSDKDSSYLLRCILRILIEEHSADMLDTLPIQALVRYVLDKYCEQIILSLNKDFEQHIQIFDIIHKFTFSKARDTDSFRAENFNPKQLGLRIEHVVNYIREQLKYGVPITFRKNRKIIANATLEYISYRVKRCFYHHCLVYLLNSLDIPGYELPSHLLKFLSDNYPLQFSNFSSLYNKLVGSAFDAYNIKSFSADILTKIYVDMISITSMGSQKFE